MDAETIRREAPSLPLRDRAELAEQLLSSLEPLVGSEIGQVWFSEAARRAEEIDRGAAKRYSADEVRQQAKSLGLLVESLDEFEPGFSMDRQQPSPQPSPRVRGSKTP